ncbi:MAG TPA: glycosyltransferase family 2 protein [Methylomirabilota bacterium]|nr:glycosyltransferase family 2 protein [Methylomirabilota bacterium]
MIVVVPVFDEAATIGRVVTGARAHGPVLVIDDGSRDGSGRAAAEAGAEVLRHPRRLGKAQALLTGIAAARRRGASLVVTLDGDGQHDPAAIPALLAAARRAERAVIVGNRLAGSGTVPAPRRNAIRVASFFTSWVSGWPVQDSQSGFRVYPLALFEEVRTRRGGFVFETEVLLAAAAHGWAVVEVGVAALPRAAERSRFRPLRDGFAIGAFLAARAAARWAREARAMAATLRAASPAGDSPVRWSAAFGAAAARRAGLRLAIIWRGARARGTPAAAVATLAAPVTLPLVLLQTVAGDWLPDLVTPLVDAVYGPAAAAGDGERSRADVAHGALVERQ